MKWCARTSTDLIIEVWEALDCESVGRNELEQIQQALRESFGEGAVVSPASIARTMADEGAALRHPEIFEADYDWRLQKLEQHNSALELNFGNLADAVSSFEKLEVKRHELGENAGELKRMRERISAARQAALLDSRSKILSGQQREEAKEISEWLTVWLRSPGMFADWLDLRMRTSEFQSKFRNS